VTVAGGRTRRSRRGGGRLSTVGAERRRERERREPVRGRLWPVIVVKS